MFVSNLFPTSTGRHSAVLWNSRIHITCIYCVDAVKSTALLIKPVVLHQIYEYYTYHDTAQTVK